MCPVILFSLWCLLPSISGATSQYHGCAHYSRGYYSISTRYFWEDNFYDVATKELLYAVQTESFDPSSMESLAGRIMG